MISQSSKLNMCDSQWEPTCNHSKLGIIYVHDTVSLKYVRICTCTYFLSAGELPVVYVHQRLEEGSIHCCLWYAPDVLLHAVPLSEPPSCSWHHHRHPMPSVVVPHPPALTCYLIQLCPVSGGAKETHSYMYTISKYMYIGPGVLLIRHVQINATMHY